MKPSRFSVVTRVRTRGEGHLGGDAVEHGGIEPLQQRHPRPQGVLEVELPRHGRLGDRRHLGPASGHLGHLVDQLPLDQRRVDVKGDQPHGATTEGLALDRDVHPGRRAGGGHLGTHPLRVGTGHPQLVAVHRVAGQADDALDVGPERSEHIGDDPECRRADLGRQHGDHLRLARLLVGAGHRLQLDGEPVATAEGGQLPPNRVGSRRADDDRQDQPLAHQHLFDVLQFRAEGGERRHQIGGDPRPVGTDHSHSQVDHDRLVADGDEATAVRSDD